MHTLECNRYNGIQFGLYFNLLDNTCGIDNFIYHTYYVQYKRLDSFIVTFIDFYFIKQLQGINSIVRITF
jgi:hypothetical protein